MITVYWRFRNDHTWTKIFDTETEAELFVNSTGLVFNQDIVEVRIGEKYLKRP